MIMKALVTYQSSTGNTKKVAEAIYAELQCEKVIRPIKDVDDASGYDIIFMGFPTHQFGADKKAVEFMKKHCTGGRKVALFITHAAPEDNPEVAGWMTKFKEAASGAEVLGLFDCQGQMSKGVNLILHLSTDKKMREWAKVDNSQGQPDEARLKKARDFAAGVLKKIEA